MNPIARRSGVASFAVSVSRIFSPARPREWVPIGTLTAEQIRRIEAQMTLDEFCRVLEREVARECSATWAELEIRRP